MSWYRRILNVLRPRRLHTDLERELAFHLRERMDDLQLEGTAEVEARRAASLQFGNMAAHMERTRDMDVNAILDSAIRNLRYAVRSLLKTPAFSVTVVLTLALGIGANSAVFSAIDAILLRPLPFPDGDQLVKLAQVNPKIKHPFVAPIRLEDWNRLNTVFSGIAGYYSEDTSETSGELPERLKHAWVSARFLQVMGISPALGRDFSPLEEHFHGPSAVLISDRFWRRRFNSDPGATGKILRLSGANFTIVGIMPPSFQFPSREVDLWSPSPADAPFAQSRELTWYTAIGRMKPAVSLAQAQTNMTAVQTNLGRQFPKTDAVLSASVEPLKEGKIGGVRQSLWLLFGSVSLLLLIACSNIAALLVSRSAARQHETSVRFSLGASRSAVVAQFFTEVLLLAVTGAIAALLVAAVASQAFRSLAKDLPRIEEIKLDWRIAIYSLACAVLVTLLCGILPAIRGTRRSLSMSLTQGGRSQVSGGNPLQFWMVSVQVALAVTLLAGAGLLLRSFQELGRVSPGFDPQRVLTFGVTSSYGEDPKRSKQRTQRILDGLQSLVGVEAAAVVSNLPGVPNQFQIELKTPEGRAESEPKMFAEARWVTPEYFATMRIPLVAGEPCRETANVGSIVVNRKFADLYLNGIGAIGRHLAVPDSPYLGGGEIRGIVGDAREIGMERAPQPTAYWCDGTLQPGTFFLIRMKGEPSAMAETVRRKIRELEPQRSVYDLMPLTDHISEGYAQNRLRTVLLTFFALTAISLASVGLYGTLSYLVTVRQREVALRMALGALRAQVVGQFLGQGLRTALFGCVAGLALAAACGRVLAGMLYGVKVTDAVTLGGVVGLVLIVSVVASLLPAVRAARVDPMQALREE